jgi:hypothetical protein
LNEIYEELRGDLMWEVDIICLYQLQFLGTRDDKFDEHSSFSSLIFHGRDIA